MARVADPHEPGNSPGREKAGCGEQLTGVQGDDQGEQGYPDIHPERQRPTVGPIQDNQPPCQLNWHQGSHRQQRTGQASVTTHAHGTSLTHLLQTGKKTPFCERGKEIWEAPPRTARTATFCSFVLRRRRTCHPGVWCVCPAMDDSPRAKGLAGDAHGLRSSMHAIHRGRHQLTPTLSESESTPEGVSRKGGREVLSDAFTRQLHGIAREPRSAGHFVLVEFE